MEAHRKIAAKKEAEQEKILKAARKLIKEHLSTLAFKYRQSIRHDDYGNESLNVSKWNKYRLEFIKATIVPLCTREIIEGIYEDLCKEVDEAALEAQTTLGQDIRLMNPYDFEEHCANILRSAGWTANATQKSGDQGIDVIAKKKRIIIAIQCKLFSGSVGNAAVQEALSGREFLKATFGAVVTNSSYTKSARQLASSTGIFLLHVDELASLETIIASR